jgi:hypothetical protein
MHKPIWVLSRLSTITESEMVELSDYLGVTDKRLDKMSGPFGNSGARLWLELSDHHKVDINTTHNRFFNF